jgi:hydroxymethylglutaryl-CoA reductase (NADPH)
MMNRMDLRTLPDGLSPYERITERRRRIELALGIDLSKLDTPFVGTADEKNCEQMIGTVHVPVGHAGPLRILFSSGEDVLVHLPLATTEAALVASVNRGCKALAASGVKTSATLHGISRSIAFRCVLSPQDVREEIKKRAEEWRGIAEQTSNHLQLLSYDIDIRDRYLYLTLAADTDEAMGMNMITIAAQKVGEWIEETLGGCTFVTVAANVDSDKKPSTRTHRRGRGFEVIAEAFLPREIISDVLKSSVPDMIEVARAKLEHGSNIADAIGQNLHAANVIAALYLATGQDAAHVVEGSLADTDVSRWGDGLKIRARLPAVIIGVRGGGTGLPSQEQCLGLLLQEKTLLHPSRQLAESIGAAVLAGELSLLAAQASHHLAKAHVALAR